MRDKNYLLFIGFMIITAGFIVMIFYLGFANISSGGLSAAVRSLPIAGFVSSLIGSAYNGIISVSTRHREHNMTIQTMLNREENAGDIAGEMSQDKIKAQAEAFRNDIHAIESVLVA